MENDVSLVSLKYPSAHDITQLIRYMRDEDKAELMASHGGIARGVKIAIKRSKFCWALRWNGKLLGICGLAEIGPHLACAWWLSTHHVDRHPIAFFKCSREIVHGLMHRFYPVLGNFVDSRYVRALEWLRRLGFTVHHNARETLNGVDFIFVESRTWAHPSSSQQQDFRP